MATEETVLRIRVDSETGKLQVFNAEMAKVPVAADKASTGLDKVNFTQERLAKSMGNVNTSIAKTQLAFAGLGGPLGQVTNQLFQVTNQIEDFEFMAKRAGKEIDLFGGSVLQSGKALGGLGTASLIVGAAVAGWKIGTWISEVTGLGKAVEEAATAMFNLGGQADTSATQLLGLLSAMNQMRIASTSATTTINEFQKEMDLKVSNAKLSADQLLAIRQKELADMKTIQGQMEAALAMHNINIEKLDKKQIQAAKEEKIKREMALITEIGNLQIQVDASRSASSEAAATKINAALAKEKAALDSLFASMTDALNPSAKLAIEIEKLMTRFSRADIIKVYGAQIADVTKKTLAMDNVVDPLIASLNAEMASMQKLTVEQANLFISLSNLPPEYTNLYKAIATLNPIQIANAAAMAMAATATEKLTIENVDLFLSLDKLPEEYTALFLALASLNPVLIAHAAALAAAATATEANKVTLEGFGSDLLKIGDIFGELANLFGSETLANIGTAFAGAGNAAKGFGRIMEGDVLGGIQQVIQGIGQLFTALKNLFSHNWAKDVSNQMDSLLHGLEVSDELTKEIAELAKELDDAGRAGASAIAVLMKLPDIMDEIGVSAENVTQFIASLRDVFSALETGILTSAEAIEILDESFPKLLESATNSLGLISPQLVEIITLTRQFGLEVASITAFVSAQLASVAEGVNKVAENMAVKTQSQFDRLQMMVLTAFNAMIANGMTAQEAFSALGPSFAILISAMDKFGFSTNDATQAIIDLQKHFDNFPKAFAVLEGINQQLIGLHNSGNLTAEAFKNLERQAKKAFNRTIIDTAHATQQELQAIAPTLQQLQYLSQTYGYELDKTTQSLIDQAIAMGILSAEAPIDPMTRLGDIMRDEVVPVVEALTAALLGIPSDVYTTVHYNTDYTTTGTLPTQPTGGGGGGHVFNWGGSYAGLVGSTTFTQPQMIAVHPGETLTGNTTSTGRSGGSMDDVHISVYFDSQPVADALYKKSATGDFKVHARAIVGRS